MAFTISKYGVGTLFSLGAQPRNRVSINHWRYNPPIILTSQQWASDGVWPRLPVSRRESWLSVLNQRMNAKLAGTARNELKHGADFGHFVFSRLP